MDLKTETICSLSERLAKGEITSLELTKDFVERAKKINENLNSFITICEDEAFAAAKEADKRIQSGRDVTKLTGIPIAIKDILLMKGVKTTCASNFLSNYVAPYDSTAVKRLLDAGAVIIGKTNMDEFAMGSSNEHSFFGPVKNPWNTEYIPGGSSGGSAAAVASGQAAAALGTDTGGSIRQPAAMCATVGLKPTYGRVSRYGMVAFASSLDQIGPITRDTADAAILLKYISGHDPNDSTSLDYPVPDYTKALDQNIKGMKIGIPKEYFISGIDEEVLTCVGKAIETFSKLGAEIKDLSLPHTEYAVPCYYIIAPAEASANLARYDGIRYGRRARLPAQTASGNSDLKTLYECSRTEGFGPEVKLRIMVGTYVLSSGYYDAYYLNAQRVRTLITRDFLNAFSCVDAILTPTSPTPPFKFGEKIDDPVQMYLSDIFTIPSNLAGLPAISVPCGFTKGGLPIGMQLIGRHLDEETILKLAYSYEQATEWHKKRPSI